MASTEELTRKYSSQLNQLKSIFPSWDEGDLAFTLQDAKGNVDEAAMMITEGRANQFTQATRKKVIKPAEKPQGQGRTHTNRNADSAGWETVNGGGEEGRAGRGGRGGLRGSRGGRGGRGGEPFRGGRGGRGGIRGGRGGFTGVNGTHKKGDLPTSTATTTEGWAAQVEQATSASGDPSGEGETAWAESTGESSATASAPAASKGDDFAAAGGFSDAPAAKELEQAAKTGGTGWQEEIKKPVQVAAPVKPKMTWAQIARPAEKPKPAPAPPVVEKKPPPPITSDEPVVQETQAPETAEEAPEEIEAFGDAPAAEELEAQAEALHEESEEPYVNGSSAEVAAEPVEEEQPEEDSWATDPAIAGSGAQPDWAKASEPPVAAIAPEPVTTYTGPPGFNPMVPKATAVAATQAITQPRTNSRAAQRYKTADDQGVVLPPAMAHSLSSMEMQFGSLSFGGLNGDGADAPVQAESKLETPAQAAPAPAPTAAVASPIRQPAPQAQTQAPAAAASQAPGVHQYYSSQQQQQQPQQAAQPATAVAPQQLQAQPQQAAQQPAQQQQQPSYTSPHQTLQQQMHAYQQQQNQWQQQQHQPAQQQQHESLHPQYNPAYRGYEQYASQVAQQQQQQPQSEATPAHQQAVGQHQGGPQSASPYDQTFGGFGQTHSYGQQAQQHQASEYGQRSYDSYGAAGYPRPMDESKQAAPAPSHTPTAPGQPQIPPQQSQYYNQMGYYQTGPYNPYYQYGQAPNHGGFQQYYPLAQRNLYGQPGPQAPPAPLPQSKPTAPSAQSPYGAASSYPTSGGAGNYDDQSYSSLGRFGGAATGSAAGAGDNKSNQGSNYPSSYGSQTQSTAGLHGFLGVNTPGANSSGRPSATTPDEGFKAGSAGSQGTASASVTAGQAVTGGAAGQRPQQIQHHHNQQQQQHQHQQHQQQQQQQQHQQQGQPQHAGANQGFGGYGGYGGYGQDWGYGGRGNGYQWQQ